MYQLDYGALVARRDEVLNHLFQHADSFAVIATLRKPYAERLELIEEAALQSLAAELIERIDHIRDWPATHALNDRHTLLRYRCNRRSREIVLGWPNPFDLVRGYPEDICFLRGDCPFFVTNTHEWLAWADPITDEDRSFFAQFAQR